MDSLRPEDGFPLCEKIEGRAALLKGYGNAIVPPLAAEFIQAMMESL
jgi:DNA (cytosine-5)-methyltransferase 1